MRSLKAGLFVVVIVCFSSQAWAIAPFGYSPNASGMPTNGVYGCGQ